MNCSYVTASCFPRFAEKLCLHEDCRMPDACIRSQHAGLCVPLEDTWLPQHVVPQQAMYLLAYLLTKGRKIAFPMELSCFWYRFMLEHKLSALQTCPLENLLRREAGGNIIWKQSPVIDRNCLLNKKMPLELNNIKKPNKIWVLISEPLAQAIKANKWSLLSPTSCFLHQSYRCMWCSRTNAVLRACTFWDN